MVSLVACMFLSVHARQNFYSELFVDALQEHNDLILALGNNTKLSSAKFVTCFLELFLGGAEYKNPLESEVGKICFRSPTDRNFSSTCRKIHSLNKS
jgi:hypothetical protein